MKRQVRPPSSTSSSTGSTVVPATSSTTTRSSPASWFSSEDLPTLGLPTIAIRRGPPTSLERLGRRLGQRSEDGVEHVARAAAVQRGDRVRLAQPEVPQPVGLGLGALVVDLVGGEHDGLAGLAQDLHHGLVGVGDADRRVDDEQHGVGERRPRSRPGRAIALGEAAGVGVPAAGVDDGEGAAVPVGVVGDPVAGHAGHVLDDRLAAADDAVDQRRLARRWAGRRRRARGRDLTRPRRWSRRARVVCVRLSWCCSVEPGAGVVLGLSPAAAGRAGSPPGRRARLVQIGPACAPAATPSGSRLVPACAARACCRGLHGCAEDDVDGAPAVRQRAGAVRRARGVPRSDDGYDGRAGHQRQVGRAVVEAVEVAAAAGALGEDADDAARRGAPAAQVLHGAGSASEAVERDLPGAAQEAAQPARRTSRSWSARAPAAARRSPAAGRR